MTQLERMVRAKPLYLRLVRRGLDLSLLTLAYWGATQARFDGMVPADRLRQLLVVLPVLLVIKYVLLRATDVTSATWRATSLIDIANLVRALALASVVLLLLRQIGAVAQPTGYLGDLTSVPYGIIVMDLVMSVVVLAGARAFRRSLSDAAVTGPGTAPEDCSRVLLVGAGGGGSAVVQALQQRPDLGQCAVGFLDDDAGKVGMTVRRLPVWGRVDQLAQVVEDQKIDQVLLTVSRPHRDLVRDLNAECARLGLPLRTVPGLSEIAGGHVNLSRIRPVELEDLLHRDSVSIDAGNIRDLVRGRTVMVTGAGGSIGSELCRQLLAFGPATLVLAERTENALYEIDGELRQTAKGDRLVSALCDITDLSRVRQVLEIHRPDVVFHAAAHKHVPMMELNPAEAIKNNALGTQVLVDACVAAEVDRFVLISTDKAVNPTSVMGTTKRAAERYVISTAQSTGWAYSAVRFGNVLGSNGSVVPLFRRQLDAGGPLTVTDPEVKRFFMTIPEAVQLVLQTAVMGTGGEIFVLDMGDQIRIVDLARDLISLSGLREGEDIDIVFTGLRPGEKLYEELGLGSEEASETEHSKIFRWEGPAEVPLDLLQSEFSRLEHDLDRPREALRRLVPEYRGGDDVVIDLGPVSGSLRSG